LKNRKEESNGLAGTGPGLRNDICALDGGVDSLRLNLSHLDQTHALGHVLDNVAVDDALILEILELCKRRLHIGGLGRGNVGIISEER
jgi:hypothetical protein